MHLLATGVWGGVVMESALALSGKTMRLVDHISRTAAIAVFFVLAMGDNALRGIGGSADDERVWGHALIVKVVLVVIALYAAR